MVRSSSPGRDNKSCFSSPVADPRSATYLRLLEGHELPNAYLIPTTKPDKRVKHRNLARDT